MGHGSLESLGPDAWGMKHEAWGIGYGTVEVNDWT